MSHEDVYTPTAEVVGGFLPLPPVELSVSMSLVEAISVRRSQRQYARRRVTLRETAGLLWAGQGITGVDHYRTSPSAGGLFPSTLLMVDERAVWRYVLSRHGLQEVVSGDRRTRLAVAAAGQEAIEEAPITIVITADPKVLRRKYPARAQRYCLLEAGHIAQNILLQATALGLGAVPIGAFDDEEVLQIVNMPEDHMALYLIPVGGLVER